MKVKLQSLEAFMLFLELFKPEPSTKSESAFNL